MRKGILLIACCFLATVSIAQPPQAINYQGVARDSVGHPLLNQNIGIRLSILDSSATGQAVYVETHSVTTNATGLFNLSIGTGIFVSGVFSEINWGQNNKWLKIEMDANDGINYQLIGSQQFMSVPYALFSKNGIQGNASVGDIVYFDGTSWGPLPGGSYGQTLTICNGVPTWGGCLPLITTTTLSCISSLITISGGNIINDGGTFIAARGVCWDISTAPTIGLSTRTSDGIGKGSFTSRIVGLIPSTTYYVRSYATNSFGTAYGTELSFTTPLLFPSICICNQTWLSKNLNVDHYRNGDSIPQVTDPNQWSTLTTGAWCYYNNDPAMGAIYGKLYNWYAVNDPRGLAPTGWHIPSDAEWTTVINCFGGSSVAGTEMKATSGWNDGGNGTNSSGFAGLPGGLRGYSGPFGFIGYHGNWWSSTEYSAALASQMYLRTNIGSSILQSNENKGYGFSVRCIWD